MYIRDARILKWANVHRLAVTIITAITVPIWYVYWTYSQSEVLGLASMKSFVTDYGLLLIIYPIVISFLPWILQKHEDVQDSLREMQKERFSLLPRFSPKNSEALYGKQSIYRAIKASLERANKAISSGDESNQVNLIAKFLLCSPALDYPERLTNIPGEFKNWGSEFTKELDKLVAHDHANLDITFLSEHSGAGFHPLDDFLQVLASYCSSKQSSMKFEDIYNDIQLATKNTILKIDAHEKSHPLRIKIKRYVQNIPFQIILFRTEFASEAIFSFAGHEILEDVASNEPIGFFTNDIHVVNELEKVYNEYTSERRRRPITPKHTKQVIQKQRDKKTPYELANYLGLNLKINVEMGCFSPLYGNSSKFTSWVISKILNQETTVLDIGAGTGVQGLVAEKTLGVGGIVYSVECVPSSFKNLEKNIKDNGSGILAVRGVMLSETNKGKKIPAWKLINSDEIGQIRNEIKGVYDVMEKGEEIVNGFIFNSNESNGDPTDICDVDGMFFDAVIADLPYCDALPENNEERAFLDMGHREHRTLFSAIKAGKWLAKKGTLITSLSSLGGTNDVVAFERLVDEYGLLVLQKFYFYEAKYMWIVYVLKRKEDLSEYNQAKYDLADSYWQNRLHINESSSNP